MNLYKLMLIIAFISLISNTTLAAECEGLNDDGALCVWLRNKTNEPIIVHSYGPYTKSADLNDDYYTPDFPLVIAPGSSKALANIDDQGWGAFNYDTVKFRATLTLTKNGKKVTTSGAYVRVDISAGIVNDFKYSTRDSGWFDNSVKDIESYKDVGNYQVTFDEQGYLRGYFTYLDADKKPDLTTAECEYLDNDGAMCVWLSNDTDDLITVHSYGPYTESADLNDDYYTADFPLVIAPGSSKALANIDDQGWGAFNYDTVKFRAELTLGQNGDKTYGAYVKAKLGAGIVEDFEYSLDGNQWNDNLVSNTINIKNKSYQVVFSESSYLNGKFSFMTLNNKAGIYDLPDWVSQVYKGRGNTTLRDMVIPGVHDAATYNINESSDLSPDEEVGRKILFSLAKKSAVAWARTQSMDIKTMLEQGVRHFDLRIKKHKGEFVNVHGFVGMKVVDVLKQVRDFSNAHPKEPIILEVAKAPSSEDIPALLKLFEKYIGDRKPDNNIAIADLTLDNIWESDGSDNKNNNVIVIWRKSSSLGKSMGYYGAESITGTWANTQKKDKLHDRLLLGLKYAPTDRLFYSNFTFTPQAVTVGIDAVNPFHDQNLLMWTKNKMRGYIGDWVPKWQELGYRPNIIAADYFEYTAMVPIAIKLNTVVPQLKLSEKLVYKLGQPKKLWQFNNARTQRDVSIWRVEDETGFYSLGDIASASTSDSFNIKFKPLLIKDNQVGVAKPLGYNWIWNSRGIREDEHNKISIWRPIAPKGFVCLGDVVTQGHSIAPSVDLMRCVHEDYVRKSTNIANIWKDYGSGASLDVSLWSGNTPEGTFSIGSMRANLGYNPPEPNIFNVLDNKKIEASHQL
ncbi:phosphatidylinositol-specific phospholipase C domain-containing protein [Vibrio splendidus]|uniref:phosphatidylinositol-specific phospholipase C domain-containing protein n=1 Tax=Vibrio splendidus TaxID=29497 RepID=UPI000066FCB8|nr:phosphatidylinositol-specific phospholipase C domain-containing protein [Vibrio splendidus]EAP95683.1 hypothetical protein V12B01_02805 [Vibrio splendidus 12B01]OCH63242.1 hypothetical protein A6D94_15635 [Vibrio splendidus]